MSTSKEKGPGWAAIDQAVAGIYGDQKPSHWGTLLSWHAGGPDPLDGVSCFDAGDHFHYVTYGLSELYEKTSSHADRSGWGFELTFRLRKKEGEPAPTWPVGHMQNLARYVYRTSNVLAVGDHMAMEQALEGSELEALLFTEDPELGAIATPNGRLVFVQLVWVTKDELDAVKDWQCGRFLSLLSESNPKLITDPERSSIRDAPASERAIQAGIDRDGSSYDAAFVDLLRWSEQEAGKTRLTISTVAVPDVLRMLRSRIPFGRAFRLYGPDAGVVFWPAGVDGRPETQQSGVRVVDLEPELAEVVRSGLLAEQGIYTWTELPGFVLEVEAPERKTSKDEPRPD